LKRRLDEDFCLEMLTPRVTALHYLDVGGGALKFILGLKSGRETFLSGRTLIAVNSDRFLADMDKLDIPISQYWDEKEYCRVAEEQVIEGTDRFKAAWLKNGNEALRDEFISLVRTSRFKHMAPLLEKRLSENKAVFRPARWRNALRFMRGG